MSDRAYNPNKNPNAAPANPGGSSIITNWDEKLDLDTYVMSVAQTPAPASLPANHDAFKQGVYRTNSVGDYD